VYASFGRAGGEKGLIVSPPKAIRPANGSGVIQRRLVDVDQCKGLIFGRLKIAEPGPEYVHLPLTVGESFADELTSERLVATRNRWGVPVKSWQQVRDRNESLDCMVLALAALRIIAPTPAHFERLAAALAAQRGVGPRTPVPPPRPHDNRPSWLGRDLRGWLKRRAPL
jgi:phage terminase large subunit GpA-like protein